MKMVSRGYERHEVEVVVNQVNSRDDSRLKLMGYVVSCSNI